MRSQLGWMRGTGRLAGGRRRISTRAVRVLVLGNGAAGAEKQALALGARLREKLIAQPTTAPTLKASPAVALVRVALSRSPLLRALPPALQVLGARLTQNPLFGYAPLAASQQQLLPPRDHDDTHTLQPLQVVIGCGRSTVALCAALKQLAPAGSSLLNVQIQHPRVPLAWFDAVIAPRHDFSSSKAAGRPAHVYLTSGTVCDLPPELLHQHECEWRDELDAKLLPGRRVVWLVGGPCRGFSFSVQTAELMVHEFIRGLQLDDQNDGDMAVLVTFSRRTPADVQRVLRHRLRSALSTPGRLLIWTGAERRNPYYALLATADLVVITPDSVSMATEAVAAAKPVCILGLERCAGKFRRFHDAFVAAGATRTFDQDAVAAALRSKATQEDVAATTAATALEHQLDEIVDSLVDKIHVATHTAEDQPLAWTERLTRSDKRTP